MKKLMTILITLSSLLLSGCFSAIESEIHDSYPQTKYLIQKAVINQTSIDALCSLLDNIDDPVLSLSCDDDGKGTISFIGLTQK
jgi:uncharacterized protein YcfL